MLANSADPDQMPLYVASDQGLNCLPMTLLRVSDKYGLNKISGYTSRACNSTLFILASHFNGGQSLLFQWGPKPKGQNLLILLPLTLLHSEQPKLHRVLFFLSATGLRVNPFFKGSCAQGSTQEVTKVVSFEN